MFYSQFILAKKGPLGTIWIAAHLERKLRKNQISDTDIGVSVDSILFPDVPIALRLSSHLLLGVVRIYSRKVNYLFHDCSEALLKIKQAFRSTAVDLPPEESTAPYHSITLPETFDLDDFELPDSAFLQGNYVDHHISTREQITLQDSVDGSGYTTSQFGLDERFGDGDASQICLDLDEDLFLDKNFSPQHASDQLGTEDGTVYEGQPSIVLTNMDIDEGQNVHNEIKIYGIPKDLSEVLSNDYDKQVLSSVDKLKRNCNSSQQHGYNIQTPDLNQAFFPDDHDGQSAVPGYLSFAADDTPFPDLFDRAQAPSTPGLIGEAIPANVQEIPTLSPREKTSSPGAMEDINTNNFVSPQINFGGPSATDSNGLVNDVTINDVTMDPKSADNAQASSLQVINTINIVSPQLNFGGPATDSNDLLNDVIIDNESVDNAHALSSLTSALTEAKPVSLAPECSRGFLAAPDEARLECGQNGKDHLHNGFVCKTKPISLASECLDGFFAAPDEAVLECGQKSGDQLQSGFVYSEVCNVPNDVEAIHPEVAFFDGLVSSSHFLEASNLDIPPNKPTTGKIGVTTSNDNVWATGVTSEITSTLPWNKADPSVLVNQECVRDVDCSLTSNKSVLDEAHLDCRQKSENHLQSGFICNEVCNLPIVRDVETMYPEVARLDSLTSNHSLEASSLCLRPCNSQMNLVNILSMEAGAIDKVDPSILANQDHVKNVGSSLMSNTPALSSNLYLNRCISQLNKTNISTSEAGDVLENVPGFSHRVPTFTSEAPLIEQPLHDNQSSFKQQGEDKRAANNTDTVQETYHKSEFVLSESISDVGKPNDQLTRLSSQKADLVNLNWFSSSGHPEPEKMLLSSSRDVNLPIVLGQLTTEKGVTESAGSVDRISSLCDIKRHLMDSSPALQNSSSMKMSGLPRVKRNRAYMPDDDDLLASILVGRTPTLRMGPTPPPSKAASRKRPRFTQRVGVPKRKVLLDDTMVLHADAIRQQLINTEDIRRMRKKAPCTRPEIWMIQKSSMEEELFSESLFTGISAELRSLHTRRYDANENVISQIDKHHLDEHDLYAELSKEMECSRVEEFARESSGKELSEPAAVLPDRVDSGMQGSYAASVSIEAQSCKEATRFDAHEKLEPHISQLEPSSSNQTVTVSAGDVYERVEVGMPVTCAPHSGNELEISSGSKNEEKFILNKCETINILQETESLHYLVQSSDKPIEIVERSSDFSGTVVDDITSPKDATTCRIVDCMELEAIIDDNLARAENTSIVKDAAISDKSNRVDVVDLNCPQYSNDVGKIENGEILVSMLDRCLLEDGAVLPADPPNVVEHANTPNPDTAGDICQPTKVETITCHLPMEKVKDGALGGEPVVKRVLDDEERSTSEIVCSENPQGVSSFLQPCIETENVSSAVGESSGLHGHIVEGVLHVESAPMEFSAAMESEVAVGGEPVSERVLADEERPTSEIICSEDPQVVSSFLHQPNTDTENVPSAVGENSGLHERNVECGLDVESARIDFGSARETSDFCSAIDDNDTEFLNVEDEADFDEAADDDLSNPEAQSLENSGWSTRTRGVARYLKTLFDEDHGRGRRVVATDLLLAGKTRKEASRMFFETLVLKTRDYIHVEQENPFDCINIKPRPKLLKSEF